MTNHQGRLIYLPCLLVRKLEFLTRSTKRGALLLSPRNVNNPVHILCKPLMVLHFVETVSHLREMYVTPRKLDFSNDTTTNPSPTIQHTHPVSEPQLLQHQTPLNTPTSPNSSVFIHHVLNDPQNHHRQYRLMIPPKKLLVQVVQWYNHHDMDINSV